VALLGIAAPNQRMFREYGKRFPKKDMRQDKNLAPTAI
jgi:hypothetical protein